MKIAPVRKEVFVRVAPDAAFRRFTAEMSLWWPLATHSVFPEETSTVRFAGERGGRIVESTQDGREADWGIVTTWQPPGRLGFTWYPARTPDTAQQVEVTFVAEAGGTRVTVVHDGWETLGDDAEITRNGYDEGWDPVLSEYVASFG